MNSRQFSLYALFVATFWIAVLVALTLGFLRLHDFSWPDGAWNPEKLGKQFFLNLGFGIAVGGWIGGVRWPGMGMLIGGLSAFTVTLLWILTRLAWGLMSSA